MKYPATLILLFFVSTTYSQITKKKVFSWDVKTPVAKSFTIDDTYVLYTRKICRRKGRTNARPFGETVERDECDKIAEGTLVEMQYLYYSALHKTALFIMLIPNYPRYQNGPPTFDLTEIKNAPFVNVWNANCFLFGKMNITSDTITFKKWGEGEDKWVVDTDPSGQFIDITHIKGKGRKEYSSVDEKLSVSVLYKRSSQKYPMIVDGTMLSSSGRQEFLQQIILYKENINCSDKYTLHIPYLGLLGQNKGIAFKGRKATRSRLPYDITEFIK